MGFLILYFELYPGYAASIGDQYPDNDQSNNLDPFDSLIYKL